MNKLPLGVLASAGAFLITTTTMRADEASAPAPETALPGAALGGLVDSAAPTLETEEQRIGYIIGTSIGENMKADQLDIDIDAFVRGLTDVLEDRELAMTEEQMMATMAEFQQKMMAQQQQQMAAAADQNAAAGVDFLTENGKRDGVTTTESGLQYEVLEAGDGERPTADDSVTVHYTGKLIDGTVFDSSVERGQPATFGVGQVIPGWTEALQMMPVGSTWRIFIPSNLAYGAEGAGGGAIGPNETLVFEVQLLGKE